MTAQILVVFSNNFLSKTVFFFLIFIKLENGFNSDKHNKMQSMEINKQTNIKVN